MMRRAMITVAVSLLLSATSWADVYLEEEQRISGMVGMPPQVTFLKSWYKKDKLKQSVSGLDQIWIIDYGKGRVTALRPSTKTYFVAPLDGYRTMLQSALQFWGVTRKSDGSVHVPKDLFKPTGKKRKIGGFQAYEVTLPMPQGAKGKMSMWISQDAGVRTADMIATLKAALLVDESKELSAFFDKLMALEGYPVLTSAETDMNGQRIVVTKELKKARKLSIADSEFAIPSGYKKVENPMQGAGAAGVAPGAK